MGFECSVELESVENETMVKLECAEKRAFRL